MGRKYEDENSFKLASTIVVYISVVCEHCLPESSNTLAIFSKETVCVKGT
jgi:hypothetical protein